MNTTIRNALIAAVLILGIGGFVYAQKETSLMIPTNPDSNAASTTLDTGVAGEPEASAEGSAEGSVETPSAVEEDAAPSLTAQVATHNTRTSCWVIINGSVYDLTSWIPRHPGGEGPILALCGTDGSASFNGKHGGSSRHESILAGFRINPGAQ